MYLCTVAEDECSEYMQMQAIKVTWIVRKRIDIDISIDSIIIAEVVTMISLQNFINARGRWLLSPLVVEFGKSEIQELHSIAVALQLRASYVVV